MKNYKNYYKKFAPDYAHRNLKPKNTANAVPLEKPSAKQSSNMRVGGNLHVNAELPHSLLHHMLLFLVASAAVVLVYQLSLPAALALAISIFIVIGYIYDALHLKKQRQKLRSLQCFNHNWFMNYVDGTQDTVEIQSISQGLGLLYLLNFIAQENKKPIRVCIWKYQSKPEFLAYCSQLFLIGRND